MPRCFWECAIFQQECQVALGDRRADLWSVVRMGTSGGGKELQSHSAAEGGIEARGSSVVFWWRGFGEGWSPGIWLGGVGSGVELQFRSHHPQHPVIFVKAYGPLGVASQVPARRIIAKNAKRGESVCAAEALILDGRASGFYGD